MRLAASFIVGLWLLALLLLAAYGQSQAGVYATATKLAGNASAAQVAHAPTGTPSYISKLTKTPAVILTWTHTSTPIKTPTKTSTPTASPSLTPACNHDTASLELEASAKKPKVGDTVKVTVTVRNEGCVALGMPQYRLYIRTDKPEPVFTPSVPEPVVHYLAVAPGQSEFRVSKSGGQPVELISFTAVIGNVAVDDTYVYWRQDNGVVMRLPKTSGGTPQPAPVPALVLDGPDAYWLNGDGDLIRSGKDGSSAITLVKGSDLKKLAGREPSAVYILEIFPKLSDIYFTVFVDNIPGMLSCSDQSTYLMSIPKSGGDYMKVARVNGGARALVTKPFAYFSGDCTQGIRKATLGAAVPEYWNEQSGELVVAWPEQASALADDAMCVYWADYVNGLIKKIAK